MFLWGIDFSFIFLKTKMCQLKEDILLEREDIAINNNNKC